MLDALTDTAMRLNKANISFYKIAKIIDEPKSTVQNIFKDSSNYSTEKVESIISRINTYLDELNNELISEGNEDPELFIKLYALGLDSKSFTPDEKYKLAVAYKKLTDSKNKQ